jgi:hypothetical protein
MSQSGKEGNDGGDCPEIETGKIVETLGEALANAGFKPSKRGRRAVGQGRRRETLKKRPYQTDRTGEKSSQGDVQEGLSKEESED